ncbi:MAG TPA: GGDEF domain-containing protein [Candidatus Limnocylindrales bacterium]|nr:GGDEF domain-containing protein [Candidatus Limnocylindrales bacterium]
MTIPPIEEAATRRRTLTPATGVVITLASLVPLLAALSSLGGAQSWIKGLLLLAAVAVTAGSVLVWRRAPRIPEAPDAEVPVASPAQALPLQLPATPDRSDEIGGIMGSFSRMLATIEQQAAEIQQFAARLESAYKELESTNARLKEFSFKDEVTGLYNRRFFSIRLEEEVSRYRRFNHPVSVLLLDLDGFKAVNDDLGHAAGDDTLRDMADILMKYSRGINVICRYGGDEFAVLLVETSKDGARLYADRIRHVLSTHLFTHGRRLSASFGIASLPEDVTPGADELIRAADEALYAAKRAGKNRVSVYEDVAATRRVPPAGRASIER